MNDHAIAQTETEREAFNMGITPEPWTADALCAQTDPEAFFPENGGSVRDAKRTCAACPVIEECLEYALRTRQQFGVWGNTSERDRRKILKERAS